MTDKPLILKLGVLDLPYGKASSYVEAGTKKPRSLGGGDISTHEVAMILEGNYGIMEYFWDTNSEVIGKELLDAMEGAAESILLGAPSTLDPYGTATSAIEAKFRDMLTMKGFDGKLAGVPTDAAERGYSKRFKKKGKKREPRPSFVDTGLFSASFRAWVGEEFEGTAEGDDE